MIIFFPVTLIDQNSQTGKTRPQLKAKKLMGI